MQDFTCTKYSHRTMLNSKAFLRSRNPSKVSALIPPNIATLFSLQSRGHRCRGGIVSQIGATSGKGSSDRMVFSDNEVMDEATR